MHRALLVVVLPLAISCTKETGSASAAPPPVKAAAESVGGAGVAGKVLERIDANKYSYLRLQSAQGEVWTAVPQSTVEVGAQVSIAGATLMTNFESKTLGRTFEQVYFGTLGAGQAAAATLAASPTAASPADTGAIKVAKAEGGFTVAEIVGKRSDFKDKPVAIRGKVVKFTGGVLGKNWIHLRDGTGSDGAKDNDITVTTQGEAAVGDVVLVKGTAHLDKDFGGGYAYPVIIEEATLAK